MGERRMLPQDAYTSYKYLLFTYKFDKSQSIRTPAES